MLSVIQPLFGNQFLLSIVAQNSEFSCHRARVDIKIVVVRNSVEFPVSEPQSVPEDADVGTEVARVEALEGGSGSVRYTFSSGGDGEGAFAINATTGVITLASLLNFELLNFYSLTIIGTNDLTGSTGSASLQVEVLDVNESPIFLTPCAQPPVGGFAECVFSVLENQLLGTLVDSLVAVDPDLPTLPNGVITFDLVDLLGIGGGFRVEQNDSMALILTTERFDREQTPSFLFTVSVMDGGTPPLSSDVTVTVLIDDENDNTPDFVQAPVLLNIRESAGLFEVVTQYIAVDFDTGVNAEIAYSLVLESPVLNSSQVPFAVDATSGVLTVIAELDFEERVTYIITIFASNPDGLRSNSSTVIGVVDVNDNPPVFTRDVYGATVVEGTSTILPIASVLATDADSGLNGRVVYTIEAGNFGGMLTISSHTTIGLILANAPIDREIISMFNLTVRATDMGVPSMSDTATVLITVLDVNDNPPIFPQEEYSVEIREDSGPRDVITVSAFDADEPQTANSEINFILNPATNIGGVFELVATDGNTAVLRLIGQLDFEERQMYELQVTASDRGVEPLSGVATIRVMVTNANEFPPVVSGNQTISVSEGEQPGARIARVNVTDLDSEELNFTIASVQGDGGGGPTGNSDLSLFSVDSNGFVLINQQLDFETSQSYAVEIRITDGELSATAVITVNVLDVNEFCPVVGNDVISVTEEQVNGTSVGVVAATDGDAGSVVTFALVQDTPAAALFVIDRQTGLVSTNQVLDREELVSQDLFLPMSGSTGQVRVVVTDSGMPPCSVVVSVGIMLLDVNDNSPVFQSPATPLFVTESEFSGLFVANVMATDSDVGENGVVLYSVSVAGVSPPEPLPFRIGSSGNLRTAIGLDAEADSSYEVTVIASDNGQSSLSTELVLVVSVTDVNDNAPVFSQEFYEVSTPENPGPEDVLIRVLAIDRDVTQVNSAITYSIDSATPPGSAGLFTIDPQTGEIRVRRLLDFESLQSHVLVVIARDQGIPQQSTSVTLAVNVTNVDEEPPRFLEQCIVSIFEGPLPPGSPSVPIGECRAADVDETTGELLFGVPLVYEILSGNDNGIFSISSDGTLFLEGSTDREALDMYLIEIRASDVTGLSAITVFHVLVLDSNDNAPVVVNAPLTHLVLAENVRRGLRGVVTVLTSDRDIGENADAVFVLSTVEVAPDGLGAVLTVVVSDRGADPLTTITTVTVEFEVPCFVQDYAIGEDSGHVTGEYLCSISLDPASLVVALRDPFDLICSSLANIPISFDFRHNGSAVTTAVGRVLTVAAATFESAGEYTCLASSEIGGLASNTAVVSTLGEDGVNCNAVWE